jgi:endonuclease-3
MESPTVAEVRAVADRLARAYPYIHRRKAAEGVFDDQPLDSLVRAVLSQNTNDRNRDVAFHTLRARFSDWSAVAAAPQDAVAEAIRASNYAITKAGRLQAILREIANEHGAYTLDFLRAWPTERVLAYLRHFPGVGAKSAAIVSLFTLGRPVVPVDTHVYRVTQRLGWIGAVTPERAHAVLQALIPSDLVLPLHMGLWEHGRLVCRPTPRCAQCPIYACCVFPTKTAPEPPVEATIAYHAAREAP